MPRYITVDAPVHESVLEANGYCVGDYVEIAGKKSGDPVTYVVEIMALWNLPYKGFTGRYYYFPSDLDEKTMALFPTHAGNHISSARDTDLAELKPEENEIFRSPFSADNPLSVIVRKCHVVQSISSRQAQDQATYLCRFAYASSSFPSPFVKIESEDEPTNCRIGPDHQADIPPMTKTSTEPVLTPKWKPSSDIRMVKTYLAVAHCLQMAIGNVVYVFNEKSKEQIPAILEEYIYKDIQWRVTYIDKTNASNLVDADFVRGLVNPDEVLFALHDANYDTATALTKITTMMSERSAMLVHEMEEDESGESDSSATVASPRQHTERQSVLIKQKIAKQREQKLSTPSKRSRN
ncbi:hypothetical protein THRCLA_02978 [Thraustotheca clavata]|uniref:BAH domain-containing protein n=1 Tax=Thraustotheca clavata TaxID=74557 RepID=A0A1W0A3H4_9STRA|nr:hypothetical protein THRCLA_02978 [Thraustotheca clavata]